MAVLTAESYADSFDHCRTVKAAIANPEVANDYPLPLSLRRNLVYLVKREMIKRGEYEAEKLDNVSGVYYESFAEAVQRVQKRLGDDPTGCLTWTVIDFYALAGR